MRQHAGTQGHQARAVAGFGGFRPLVPRKLETVHVGGHGIVGAARIERGATVEPPGFHPGAVTPAQLADNAQQIIRQAGLVGRVVADRALPGRVITVITGVIVIEDEMQPARPASIRQFSDQIPRRRPLRGDAINGSSTAPPAFAERGST